MPRGLCGAVVFALLVLWSAWSSRIYGGTGSGGGGNTTFTTSTTHHTTVIGLASGGQCPVTAFGITTVSTTDTFGPATILIGDDQSQSFFVAAGTENINTNTDFTSFIKVCASAAPALAPWALELCAVLLAVYATWALRRRAARTGG